MAQGKKDPGENHQHKSMGTEEDSDRILRPHVLWCMSTEKERDLRRLFLFFYSFF